ncbi:MAG: zinc ABC transporter substrate-binding protein [Clostridiales bacterium]|nr:zinc ABC transporter substrate-binding protein [Clostridiales bacterium]
MPGKFRKLFVVKRTGLFLSILSTALLIGISAATAGCADNSGTVRQQETTVSGSMEAVAPGEPSEGSLADKKIITSFYPMYITTINITKDVPGVTVTNMTEPQTGCLHDYGLKTGDMKKLEEGDIFVINGAGMESFLEEVTGSMPNLKIVNASEGIELLKDPETGEDNPHVWVSITGAIEQTVNIAERLAELDPSNEALYRSNSVEYVKKLEALSEKMHNELKTLKTRDIVTFHEAFPYFAEEFDLNIKAVLVQEEGDSPDARKLAQTIDIVKSDGIRALFTEPQYSQIAAETVSRETGAKIYTLDPVVTGEANGDADAYIRKMEANLEVLKEALGN